MLISDLAGKKILILGLGMEGIDTYRFLRQHFPEQKFALADKHLLSQCVVEVQQICAADQNLILFFGPQYLEHLQEYDVVIKAPGISFHLPQIAAAQKAGKQFTSATEIFFAHTKGKIIGITGSKGKSTTASLIFSILKADGRDTVLLGNIGAPPLKYLATDSSERLYVFELSSYQLETLTVSPQIGLMTSFFPAHLDHHGSLEEYFAAKMNIARFMTKDDVFLFNAEFSEIAREAAKFSGRLLPYNDGTESTIRDGELIHAGQSIMSATQVPLLGRHNLENVLGAIAVAKLCAVSDEIIRTAVSEFQPLEHRLELIGKFRGIRFYNDSISTTPESTLAAVRAFGKDLGALIVGGEDSGFDLEKMGQELAKLSIPTLIFLPGTGPMLQKIVQKFCSIYNFSLPIFAAVSDMKAAVERAYALTSRGKVCVLSPGAPSFNLFANFQERGRIFKKLVQEYAQNLSSSENSK